MTKIKKYRMSVEELRTFEGFEHINDVEAEATIDTLEKFAKILLELYLMKQEEK